MVANFTVRTYDVNKVLFRKKIGFDDSFDVTNAFNKSKYLIYSMIVSLMSSCVKSNDASINPVTLSSMVDF